MEDHSNIEISPTISSSKTLQAQVKWSYGKSWFMFYRFVKYRLVVRITNDNVVTYQQKKLTYVGRMSLNISIEYNERKLY